MLKTLLRSLMVASVVAAVALNVADPARVLAFATQAQTVSMPGYPAPGSPPMVTLSTPGAMPRTPLRFKVANGLKEAFDMTTTVGLTMSMEGMSMPPMDLPAMKMSADVGVTDVA